MKGELYGRVCVEALVCVNAVRFQSNHACEMVGILYTLYKVLKIFYSVTGIGIDIDLLILQ
jgi:hypothetical protein